MSAVDPMDFIDTSELFEAQQSLQSKECELDYEKCLRGIKETCELENARQMRLRILLLENENDDLHERLSQSDDRIDQLETGAEEMQQTIADLESSLQEARNGSRLRSRDLESLKTEIESLNHASKTSSKVLMEKLALSRELSTIKPEVEHLRYQLATNQNLLSEKLSLERQLSTLQVELENEKRASQRALSKSSKEVDTESIADEQSDLLQKEIAKERKDRQTLERDFLKAETEWQNRKDILEGRIDALKTKLRSTKEQLKETKSDLQSAKENIPPTQPANTKKAAANPRKRKAASLIQDETIGTPDGIARDRNSGALKKAGRVSTMPGEKSTFSITPFLNRTASLAPESPAEDNGTEIPEVDREDELSMVQETEDFVVRPAQPSPSVPKKKAVSRKPKSAKGATNTNALQPIGITATNASARPRKAPSLLEVVPEDEENEENLSSGMPPPAPQQPPSAAKLNFTKLVADTPLAEQNVEHKTKKRKLLGGGLAKTLFDEDDAEPKKTKAPLLAGGKGLAGLGRTALGASKARVIGTSAGGFAQFSPRKKDKRALSRSILQ